MATVDGIVPFADPFAYYGMYDPNDPLLQFSQIMGQVARDILLLTLSFRTMTTIATWCRNPFFYEIGSTTVPQSVWHIIQGMSVINRGRYLCQAMVGERCFLVFWPRTNIELLSSMD
jgi:hypothetical protein